MLIQIRKGIKTIGGFDLSLVIRDPEFEVSCNNTLQGSQFSYDLFQIFQFAWDIISVLSLTFFIFVFLFFIFNKNSVGEGFA